MARQNKQFDPGFGKTSLGHERIINKDGSVNVLHMNRTFQFRDVYHFMINTSWFKFFSLIFLGYLFLNSIFALIFFLLDNQITGADGKSTLDSLWLSFFFSTQTFTTLGYGVLAPTENITRFVAAIEAFVGLLSFAFATGLLYGRFSKARPNLKFSQKMVLREYNGNKVLMFRLMHMHPNVVMNVSLDTILSLKTKQNGKYQFSYYSLPLERNHINFLTTTWTVVAILDEVSPFTDLNFEEISQTDGELVISVNYYDETFNQEIFQRNSFLLSETEINHKFVPAHEFKENGFSYLDHEILSKTERL